MLSFFTLESIFFIVSRNLHIFNILSATFLKLFTLTKQSLSIKLIASLNSDAFLCLFL